MKFATTLDLGEIEKRWEGLRGETRGTAKSPLLTYEEWELAR